MKYNVIFKSYFLFLWFVVVGEYRIIYLRYCNGYSINFLSLLKVVFDNSIFK